MNEVECNYVENNNNCIFTMMAANNTAAEYLHLMYYL